MLMQQMQQQGGQGGSNALSAMSAAAEASVSSQSRSNVIKLPQDEKKVIERLKAKGFDEHQAMEAYMVCGKNEELAANYLFDNHDFVGKRKKLEQCTVKQICYIIKNFVIKNEESELYDYRDNIIKYLVEKDIDGAKFVKLTNDDKDKLIQDLKKYLNNKDNKLDALLSRFIMDICALKVETIQFD